MKKISALCIMACALGACSNAGWYKGMQTSEQNRCLTVPPGEYDDCMKNANDSYDEYQDKRKELEK